MLDAKHSQEVDGVTASVKLFYDASASVNEKFMASKHIAAHADTIDKEEKQATATCFNLA